MEPESQSSITNRRRKRLLNTAAELGVAALFVVAILGGSELAEGGALAKFAAAGGAIIILSLWWWLYYRQIAQLDELERSISIRALAIAGAVTIWVATVWGLLHVFAGAPLLPLVFVAPLAAVISCVTRAFLVFGYK